MRRASALGLLLVLAVFGTGCAMAVEAATDPMGRKAAFKRQQRDYTQVRALGRRRGRLALRAPEVREEFLAYEGDFDGIRVTDFEVGEMTFGPKEETAQVRVRYHAYSMKTMLEKEIKETQTWERVSGNAWMVRPHLDGLVEQVADLR